MQEPRPLPVREPEPHVPLGLRLGYGAHTLAASVGALLYATVVYPGPTTDRVVARILLVYPILAMLIQRFCTGSWKPLLAPRPGRTRPDEPPPWAKGPYLVPTTIHLAVLLVTGVVAGVAYAPVFAFLIAAGFVLAWLLLPDTLRHLRHHLDAGLSPRSRDGRGALYVLGGGFQILGAVAALAASLLHGPGTWVGGRYLCLGLLGAGLGLAFVTRRRWTPCVLAEYVPLGLGLGLWPVYLLHVGGKALPPLELAYVMCHVIAAGLLLRELHWVSRRTEVRY